MDNNQDKNIWQQPKSQSDEFFDTRSTSIDTEKSQAEVDQAFAVIERGYTDDTFNEIIDESEMLDMWHETRQLAEVAIFTPNPMTVELLQLASQLQDLRVKHYEERLERVRKMGRIRRAFTWLTAKNPNAILNPTLDDLINEESELGVELFVHDPDVTQIRYFLHDNEWFHEQKSAIPAKRFTNKYEVSEQRILKSSTFVDPYTGQEILRTVVVGDEEAKNVLIASKMHFEKVTNKVYTKTAAPRYRFGSKTNQ